MSSCLFDRQTVFFWPRVWTSLRAEKLESNVPSLGKPRKAGSGKKVKFENCCRYSKWERGRAYAILSQLTLWLQN